MSQVNLVSLSSPSAMTGCNTAEEFIAYAARVSNPANQNNTATAQKLIGYLIREQHWSPFEMVSVTMEITTTRDISRQILRHRSFSFQEFSQRYAVSENFTSREARLQDTKNRQNSIEIMDEDYGKGGEGSDFNKYDGLIEQWTMKQREVIRKSQEDYEWALENGIAKEQARAVLPEGNTETTLYMAGTLRSWIHYCDLRRGNGTQKEHMVVAEKCWNVLQTHFPNVCEVVENLNEKK
jgi:thymidylate synthase (FAD)